MSGGDPYSQFSVPTADFPREPNWGDPDGWGVTQCDASSEGTPPITTAEVWNWHDNVGRGVSRLVDKMRHTATFFDLVQEWYPDKWEEPPSIQFTPTVTFTGREVDTIMGYNGWGHTGAHTNHLDGPGNQKRDMLSAFIWHPENPSGQRWVYVPNMKNYVENVAAHMEAANVANLP